jgi:hypothetical protein
VRTWQEVVADEHAEQDEVVDDALQVEAERKLRLAGFRPELHFQVISHLSSKRSAVGVIFAVICADALTALE